MNQKPWEMVSVLSCVAEIFQNKTIHYYSLSIIIHAYLLQESNFHAQRMRNKMRLNLICRQ